MLRKFALIGATAALVAGPNAASAETGAYRLSLKVGVHCTVQHDLSGYGQQSAGGFTLGELREYCNSQHGYELLVRYTPGSLRGTVIRAGDDEVVLNGSGEAILSRADGPRIRERMLSATPGESGFDARSIEFRMIAA
ncbi:MAG TPA: hypothetical protein VFS69_03020 [Sphingomicrobium sp.]|jgi:hypothetical protein|nr:hypothetical protein [Sphingomicrobium sp.]